MSSQPSPPLSPAEYLAIERKAEKKSEYLRGVMYAMSGASAAHVLIVSNVVAALHGQLRKGNCSVYATDLRVKVAASNPYTYPDVVVACGDLQFDDEQKDTLLNPTLIIEVLSDSARDYDRGAKFEHYRKIRSFVEYVLIAQDACHVEHFVRQPNVTWLFSETERLNDVVELPSIGCRLAPTDVYERVALGT